MSRTSPDAPDSMTPDGGDGSSESRSLREFLATETGSAGLLLLATVIALVWANSPWSAAYAEVWDARFGSGVLDLDLRHWVNDAAMAFFFYVVGLEIRRELAVGELRDWRAAMVPAIAAFAGMLVPAAVYSVIVGGGEAGRGWGIVMATDIAFVLGTLALLGNRVPSGVRVFLLTLAIVDDIGAIAVIAAFYSHGFSVAWFAVAVGLAGAIALAASRGNASPAAQPGGGEIGPVGGSCGRLDRGAVWLAAGVVLWFATLESGIHPTIAGVVMGVLTPVALGERFQHVIHPWTSFLVIPVFAIANAGVDLGGLGDALGSTVTLAVIAGLVLGKALGVSLATLTAVRAGVGPLPSGVRRGHIGGAATLAGIGFTVSLFVTDLAFENPVLRDQAKIGVLAASLIAATAGLALLARTRR